MPHPRVQQAIRQLPLASRLVNHHPSLQACRPISPAHAHRAAPPPNPPGSPAASQQADQVEHPQLGPLSPLENPRDNPARNRHRNRLGSPLDSPHAVRPGNPRDDPPGSPLSNPADSPLSNPQGDQQDSPPRSLPGSLLVNQAHNPLVNHRCSRVSSLFHVPVHSPVGNRQVNQLYSQQNSPRIPRAASLGQGPPPNPRRAPRASRQVSPPEDQADSPRASHRDNPAVNPVDSPVDSRQVLQRAIPANPLVNQARSPLLDRHCQPASLLKTLAHSLREARREDQPFNLASSLRVNPLAVPLVCPVHSPAHSPRRPRASLPAVQQGDRAQDPPRRPLPTQRLPFVPS